MTSLLSASADSIRIFKFAISNGHIILPG
jgi:hypothetical protein